MIVLFGIIALAGIVGVIINEKKDGNQVITYISMIAFLIGAGLFVKQIIGPAPLFDIIIIIAVCAVFAVLIVKVVIIPLFSKKNRD